MVYNLDGLDLRKTWEFVEKTEENRGGGNKNNRDYGNSTPDISVTDVACPVKQK